MNEETDPIVITGMARTPMGGFQGELTALSAPQLGSAAIYSAVERSGVNEEDIDQAIMGNVLSAGLGQAPARQAALGAGLPDSTACTTINKMCGSGLKAVMLACDEIKAGNSDIMVAGGMESMTNAPYLLPRARSGYRMGHGEIIDHMFFDGLEDAYDKGKLMGVFAEDCARHYQFTRESQDEFAITSLKRAQLAAENGWFESEIVPVNVTDEQPGKANFEKIPSLRPAFAEDGTVTAANASSISDGAAALVLMKRSVADKKGCQILATVKGYTSFAHAPEWFTTAPVGALKRLYEITGWSANDVELYEINEAFAVVSMAAMQELSLPHEIVNIHGGACALGHPIGASGARILVTLIAAMEQNNLGKGMASLCIGGGEAVALAVEKEK
jgi:acetyl-CoA C-acetyltransferase